jgi:hypothetical protein
MVLNPPDDTPFPDSHGYNQESAESPPPAAALLLIRNAAVS